MLSPKRVKFRKRFKGRTTGLAHRGSEISFGTYGLQALEPGWITARQIEAARIAIERRQLDDQLHALSERMEAGAQLARAHRED